MTDPVLLDTGVVVALVNAADPDHDACVAAWTRLRRPVVTVEGVLVEATHLLRKQRGGAEAAVGLVVSAGTILVPATTRRLEVALARMAKYRSVPMDFVDAMLVAVAEELSLDEVLTLDRRGFCTYRLQGKHAFRVLPDR